MKAFIKVNSNEPKEVELIFTYFLQLWTKGDAHESILLWLSNTLPPSENFMEKIFSEIVQMAEKVFETK